MPRISRPAQDDSDEESSSSSTTPRGKGSQTPRSQSQASSRPSPNPGGLTQDDVEKLVSDVVFYFLVADQKKQLIKRPELCKNCDLSRKSRADQDSIIDKAKLHLATVFGIRVEELENKKGHYILVNQLAQDGNSENDHIYWSDNEAGQMGLTFSLLGLVFMNGGKVSDEILFKFLKSLGVSEDIVRKERGREKCVEVDPEVAALFGGDVKKFVNEVLVAKQHYLARARVPHHDVDKEIYEYTWGDRAEKEVKRSNVLKMVCELYDNCSPKMFKEQLEKVIALEGEDAMDHEGDEDHLEQNYVK